MARQVFNFTEPARFVVGTVGMPGERTFFLQARQGNLVTSVVIEKQQALVLAERTDQLLDEVRETRIPVVEIPSAARPEDVDIAALDLPIYEEFKVGAMALGWDEATSKVVIEAHAVAQDGDQVPEIADDDLEGVDTLRVWLSPAQARSFAERARAVAAAGRPPCPFCNQPLDPEGHICPRANGYRRRT